MSDIFPLSQALNDIDRDALRDGETSIEIGAPSDATLYFIGKIHTPWNARQECPRQGKEDGPLCEIEVFEPWVAALDGIEAFERVEVLYWLDRARRDLVTQTPARNGKTHGTFALRSPARPNPIGTSLVKLIARDKNIVSVQGLECVNGTALIDLKPVRCEFTPLALPKDGRKPDNGTSR